MHPFFHLTLFEEINVEEMSMEKGGPLQMSKPIIPDSIVGLICSSVGFVTEDVRIIRTISLATQAFMADITNNAMHHHKLRSPSATTVPAPGPSGKQPKYPMLTMKDLIPALKDKDIIVKKPPYLV